MKGCARTYCGDVAHCWNPENCGMFNKPPLHNRFKVKWVPVPEGGHIVEDTFALPVRLHAGGVLYNRYERHQPHSRYYETHEDAQAVADWLTDRAAGYPFNPLLGDIP